MSAGRVTCCNCASKVIDLQQELKMWKSKSIIEQKCRKILQHWILSTFCYDVKVEMDQERKTARIQAIENKEAMKTASSDLMEHDESSESEVKIMITEIRLDEDFLDFDDTSSVFPEVKSEPETKTVAIASPKNLQGQGQIETAVPIEIGSGPNAEVVYITGNYSEENNSGEIPSSSYFILRSGNNEEIPVQIDYSHFMNGDNVIQGDNNLFYRFAPTSEVSVATTTPTPIKPHPEIQQSSPSQISMHSSAPIEQQTIIYNPAMLTNRPPAGQRKKQNPKIIGTSSLNPTPAKAAGTSRKKNPAGNKNNSDVSSSPTPTKQKRSVSPNQQKNVTNNEFGLTLREKAEVYVSIKAREAVRKVSNGYECGICTTQLYTYSTIDSCMTHTKVHFEGKPYKCESCKELFTVQRELLVHKREKHPRIKPIAPKPPTTAAATAKMVKLKEEQQKSLHRPGSSDVASAAGKKWKCQVAGCTWSYATAEELGWHIKAHSQSRV